MEIAFPQRAVLVVIGVPGAGKTTLIDRIADRRTMRVVDTEDQRRAGHRRRPKAVRVLVHYARILRAMVGDQPVVIHSRGTRRATRRVIALLARVARRPAQLMLLVVDPGEAVAGQHVRGRVIEHEEMGGHVRRFAALAQQSPAAIARAEGWSSVRIMSRTQAAELAPLRVTARAAPVVARVGRSGALASGWRLSASTEPV